uniref:Uncharacterized protein n=1 Tax=Salix viminalis TaxID=40686 RepID=A0A6N2KNB3_SALVM
MPANQELGLDLSAAHFLVSFYHTSGVLKTANLSCLLLIIVRFIRSWNLTLIVTTLFHFPQISDFSGYPFFNFLLGHLKRLFEITWQVTRIVSYC